MTTPEEFRSPEDLAMDRELDRRSRRRQLTRPAQTRDLGLYGLSGIQFDPSNMAALQAQIDERTFLAQAGGRLDQIASKYQTAVESLSRSAHAKMIRAYAPVYRQLQSDTKALMAIAQERQLKPWELGRLERFKQLETQFLAGSSRFARTAGDLVTQAQLQAVGLSGEASELSYYASRTYIPTDPDQVLATTFNRLPNEALTQLVGFAEEGTPLSELFERLGPETAPKIRETLYQGVAMGYNPAKTARMMRDATGLPLTRALTISRTETMRAFREGSRRNYVNNAHLIHSYERHASKSERTCMACIALDGTLYEVYEPFPSHPNCRCVILPVPMAPNELTLEFPRRDMEQFPLTVGPRTERPPSARDWFAAQPDERQIRMMGRRKWESYKAGRLQLNELAAYRFSEDWGRTVGLATIRELDANGFLLSHIPGRIHLASEIRQLIDPETNARVSGTLTTPPRLDDLDEIEEVLRRRGHPHPTIIREVDDPKAITHQNRRKQDYVLQFEDWEEWRKSQELDVLLEGFDDPDQALRIQRQILATDMLLEEQEAWARAMNLARETSYYGLAPEAGRQLNVSLYRTIGKNRWKPMRTVTTTDRGEAFISYDELEGIQPNNTTMAYQGADYMVVNSDMIPNGQIDRWNIATGERALRNARYRSAMYGKKADPILVKAQLDQDPRVISIRQEIENLKEMRAGAYEDRDNFGLLQNNAERYKEYLTTKGRSGMDLPDSIEARLYDEYLQDVDLNVLPYDARLKDLPSEEQIELLDDIIIKIQSDRREVTRWAEDLDEEIAALNGSIRRVETKINEGLMGVKDDKELIRQYRHNTGESFQLDDDYDVTMFENTIEHEIGHYIHRRYDIDDPLAMKIFADGNIQGDPHGWGCKHLHVDGKGISLYGDSNHAEYFAEAFSEYLHIPNSPNIPPQMRRYIQNVMDANTLYSDEPGWDTFLADRINRETLMQGVSLPMREKYAKSLQNAILKVQAQSPGVVDVVPVFVPGPAGLIARRATRIRGVMRLFRAEAVKAGVKEGTYELSETEEAQTAVEQIARAEAYWALSVEVPRAFRVPRLVR